MLFYKKWKQYTSLEKLQLHLFYMGNSILKFMGYIEIKKNTDQRLLQRKLYL